jgi:hypothetical protein
MVDPGHQCRRLAGVAAELDDLKLRVMFGRGLERLLRGIPAAIIDRDDFVAVVQAVEFGNQRFELASTLVVEFRR